jgi:hypothetical protein
LFNPWEENFTSILTPYEADVAIVVGILGCLGISIQLAIFHDAISLVNLHM